jgi:hypothetical protein
MEEERVQMGLFLFRLRYLPDSGLACPATGSFQEMEPGKVCGAPPHIAAAWTAQHEQGLA